MGQNLGSQQKGLRNVHFIMSQQCWRKLQTKSTEYVLLHPQPSCRINLCKPSCFFRWLIPSLQDTQLFWRTRSCLSLFLKQKKKWKSVRYILRFVHTCYYPSLNCRLTRRYTRNFVSTCESFVALNRASKLATVFSRILYDFDVNSLRFNSIALRFQHDRLHCDSFVICVVNSIAFFECNFTASSVRF